MNRLTKQRAPFTQVPNELLNDHTISLKAKGLWALMDSKPDGWTFYESALAKECKEGKEAISSGLDELVEAGWLRRSGGREEGTHRFTAYDYELLVTRDGKAVTENPSRETRDGKPATSNTEERNKEEDIPPVVPQSPLGFDAFWQAYPLKVGKPKALASWNKQKLEAISGDVLGGLDRWKRSSQWKRDGGKFIPHPTTFLNQRRWEDSPEPERAVDPYAPLAGEPVPF